MKPYKPNPNDGSQVTFCSERSGRDLTAVFEFNEVIFNNRENN